MRDFYFDHYRILNDGSGESYVDSVSTVMSSPEAQAVGKIVIGLGTIGLALNPAASATTIILGVISGSGQLSLGLTQGVVEIVKEPGQTYDTGWSDYVSPGGLLGITSHALTSAFTGYRGDVSRSVLLGNGFESFFTGWMGSGNVSLTPSGMFDAATSFKDMGVGAQKIYEATQEEPTMVEAWYENNPMEDFTFGGDEFDYIDDFQFDTFDEYDVYSEAFQFNDFDMIAARSA